MTDPLNTLVNHPTTKWVDTFNQIDGNNTTHFVKQNGLRSDPITPLPITISGVDNTRHVTNSSQIIPHPIVSNTISMPIRPTKSFQRTTPESYMIPTFLDWLYLSDPVTTSEKQGALIIFPRMVDRWNVASLIVSKWEAYKVFIVTDHPNEFMHTISDNTSWTDLELIPFPLVKYSDIADINRILRNTEIDIVLFDDARMLATISSGIDFTSIQPKIIVLTSWGDTYKQLDVITSKLPDLRLLTLDLISDTADIKWNVVKVPMSPRQLKFYDQIRGKELSDVSTHKIPYPLTRMVTLYAYPDVIMNDTLKHKSICETDQSSIPDNLDGSLTNTWLNNSYLNNLETHGPKLESLLDGIVGNWPNKQIISTRFNHRYGVDLIVSFLQLMSQNKKSPYELNEIFHISCTDNYDTAINTLYRFNDSESGVLIGNIVPLIPLKGVSIVHVVDSYSFLTLKMIIDRCHKRYLSNGGMDFTIYSHIATHPTEISSDLALYEILSKDVQEANRIYTGLINSSGHIVFKPGTGLLVL